MSIRGPDSEMIAQELSALGRKLDDIEKRLAAVEKVNTRLEEAALTTARALGEISGHWDAVYEAMRRRDESQQARRALIAGDERVDGAPSFPLSALSAKPFPCWKTDRSSVSCAGGCSANTVAFRRGLVLESPQSTVRTLRTFCSFR